MRVFRIEKGKYLDQTLSGHGAASVERNRWNRLNTPLVYSAQSRALALLELLVHLDISKRPPRERYYVEIEIPDQLPIEQIEMVVLPPNWTSSPPGFETQRLGDTFVNQHRAPVLKVPSSIVPGEFNYLINPLHQDMKSITVISVEPLGFDGRLLGGPSLT